MDNSFHEEGFRAQPDPKSFLMELPILGNLIHGWQVLSSRRKKIGKRQVFISIAPAANDYRSAILALITSSNYR